MSNCDTSSTVKNISQFRLQDKTRMNGKIVEKIPKSDMKRVKTTAAQIQEPITTQSTYKRLCRHISVSIYIHTYIFLGHLNYSCMVVSTHSAVRCH